MHVGRPASIDSQAQRMLFRARALRAFDRARMLAEDDPKLADWRLTIALWLRDGRSHASTIDFAVTHLEAANPLAVSKKYRG